MSVDDTGTGDDTGTNDNTGTGDNTGTSDDTGTSDANTGTSAGAGTDQDQAKAAVREEPQADYSQARVGVPPDDPAVELAQYDTNFGDTEVA